MEFEVLFWLGVALLNLFLAVRIIRRIRTRSYVEGILNEAFERHRRADEPGPAAEPSYARERYSRDDWAA